MNLILNTILRARKIGGAVISFIWNLNSKTYGTETRNWKTLLGVWEITATNWEADENNWES